MLCSRTFFSCFTEVLGQEKLVEFSVYTCTNYYLLNVDLAYKFYILPITWIFSVASNDVGVKSSLAFLKSIAFSLRLSTPALELWLVEGWLSLSATRQSPPVMSVFLLVFALKKALRQILVLAFLGCFWFHNLSVPNDVMHKFIVTCQLWIL